MSDLQRDMERLDAYMNGIDALPLSAYEAWQRIRARLTPDRERVIEAIDRTLWNSGVRLTPSQRADAADAAIDAARKA